MEEGNPQQVSAPPYSGQPMNYGGMVHLQEMHPHPGFSPGSPPPVVNQGVTHVDVTTALQDVPGQMLCPYCYQTVVTTTEHKAGHLTWAVCCGLTIFGCILCSCIPFCIDSCKDVEHRCPSCHRVIYLYK
ncbi:LITAF domain-containing protein-like [Platichthys flesus]|uniref:LITAF domain-containing protein-like n=1 Tax=Platichthys flesus TaxID=8260 RepID=UPI002DBEA2B9|nr:LITAF domain-containing protein-like [Platichthys flesus]